MAIETVAIHVPQALYQRLVRLAALTKQPLERVIVQTLSSNLPPLPDDLPTPFHDALVALETLSDAELWQVMHSTVPDEQYEQWTRLREKRRTGTITESEQARIDQLTQAADLLTLRKAYAAVLLKWRGHQLPPLTALAS